MCKIQIYRLSASQQRVEPHGTILRPTEKNIPYHFQAPHRPCVFDNFFFTLFYYCFLESKH